MPAADRSWGRRRTAGQPGGSSQAATMDADPLLGEELTTTAVLHAPLAVVQVNLATTRVAAVSEMAAALVAATPAELVGLPARELVANAHDAD